MMAIYKETGRVREVATTQDALQRAILWTNYQAILWNNDTVLKPRVLPPPDYGRKGTWKTTYGFQ